MSKNCAAGAAPLRNVQRRVVPERKRGRGGEAGAAESRVGGARQVESVGWHIARHVPCPGSLILAISSGRFESGHDEWTKRKCGTLHTKGENARLLAGVNGKKESFKHEMVGSIDRGGPHQSVRHKSHQTRSTTTKLAYVSGPLPRR